MGKQPGDYPQHLLFVGHNKTHGVCELYIRVVPDDVDTYNADERGRVYLGPEYANKTVEVAVVDNGD